MVGNGGILTTWENVGKCRENRTEPGRMQENRKTTKKIDVVKCP